MQFTNYLLNNQNKTTFFMKKKAFFYEKTLNFQKICNFLYIFSCFTQKYCIF